MQSIGHQVNELKKFTSGFDSNSWNQKLLPMKRPLLGSDIGDLSDCHQSISRPIWVKNNHASDPLFKIEIRLSLTPSASNVGS